LVAATHEVGNAGCLDVRRIAVPVDQQLCCTPLVGSRNIMSNCERRLGNL
jgi:hypothetical protein